MVLNGLNVRRVQYSGLDLDVVCRQPNILWQVVTIIFRVEEKTKHETSRNRRQYVGSKHQALSVLHGIIIQKTMLFIVTTMTNSKSA
jgi:hypothetical protein